MPRKLHAIDQATKSGGRLNTYERSIGTFHGISP